jgi:hypothetical protein
MEEEIVLVKAGDNLLWIPGYMGIHHIHPKGSPNIISGI